MLTTIRAIVVKDVTPKQSMIAELAGMTPPKPVFKFMAANAVILATPNGLVLMNLAPDHSEETWYDTVEEVVAVENGPLV